MIDNHYTIKISPYWNNEDHYISKKEELFRVLSLLFATGYVFNAEFRFRTIKDFINQYGDNHNYVDWNYITFPKESGCNVVVDARWLAPTPFKKITVEDFLKLPENER